MIGITGSTGFIGSYLKENFKLGKIIEFEGNLLDKEAVENFVKKCSSIIHLAGVFSNNFDELYQANVITTRNLVDSALKHNVEKLIFTSTGGIYGSATEPWRENDSPTPDTLYGLSKLYAELYIKFAGINYVILRFPNVYGPGSNKGVISNFINQIKTQGDIVILGDGKQKRDFLHVHDACTAIEKALNSDFEKEIFNVSNKNYSLNEVAEILKKLSRQEIEVVHKAADKNNKLLNLSLDTSKIQTQLNWKPEISLKEGLKELV